MTYEVYWSETALDCAAKFAQDDHAGIVSVLGATDMLATNPCPTTARSVGLNRYRYRVRVGVYRLIYEVDGTRIVIEVLHLGRTTAR